MIRSLLLLLALSLAAPLAAQTTVDSDAGTEAGEDTLPADETASEDAVDADGDSDASEPAGEAETGIGENAISTVEDADPAASTAGGLETGRPEPASPEGIKGLENPDAEAFAEGRRNNSELLADRQDPDSYPTLDARDEDGGALDGAAPADTLDAKKADRDARALFTALAAMNCRIAERDVAERLAPMGFDPEAVTNTLATLYVEGAASLDAQGYLQLPASVCPPDEPAASPRDAIITAMRDNGCSADEDSIRAAPGVSDLSDAQLLAILGPMRDRGEIETGTREATLSEELCQED